MRVALLLLVIVPPCSLQFLEQAPRTEISSTLAQSQTEIQSELPDEEQWRGLSVEEKKIHKVLDAWVSQFRNMKSYAFDFDWEESMLYFKHKNHWVIKAKIMMGQQDQYSVSYETCDDKGKPQRTLIFANSRMMYLCSATKQINITGLKGKLGKKELLSFATFVPLALPVFMDSKSDILDHFTVSVVQEDSDYVWMKLIPKTDEYKRSFAVMQIGVVKYANTVSPNYFPLVVQFRDPSGNEITCRFTKVWIIASQRFNTLYTCRTAWLRIIL